MLLKPALAGVMMLVSLPGGLTKADFGPDTFISNPYVAQVFCDTARGTAFKISTGQWISVHHVSVNGGCRINGFPIHVVHNDPSGDFSVIDFGDRSPGGLEIDCGGFQKGRWYYGLGHGWGLHMAQSKAVQHTSHPWLLEPHFNRLDANRFVPGMSGGPVIDDQNRVVGTVNAYAVFQRASYSRALKDSAICQDSAAQSPDALSARAG
jgi:hypothetical protein